MWYQNMTSQCDITCCDVFKLLHAAERKRLREKKRRSRQFQRKAAGNNREEEEDGQKDRGQTLCTCCVCVCCTSWFLVCSSCSSSVCVCLCVSVWATSVWFVSSCWSIRVTAACCSCCSLLSSDWLLSTCCCRRSSSSDHTWTQCHVPSLRHTLYNVFWWQMMYRCWSVHGRVLAPPAWLAARLACRVSGGGRAGRRGSVAESRRGFQTGRALIGCSESAVATARTAADTHTHDCNNVYWSLINRFIVCQQKQQISSCLKLHVCLVSMTTCWHAVWSMLRFTVFVFYVTSEWGGWGWWHHP